MIEVRVREDDAIDGVGRHGKGSPVAQAEILEPLEHSAVNQDPPAIHLQQVLGAGDGPGGSEKRQRRHPRIVETIP